MLYYRLFIEEYFLENVWRDAVQRLKDTVPDVPESTISFYVNEFKNLKNQKSLQQFKDAISVLDIQIDLKYPENDINAYKTFEDLEKIVDYLKSAYVKPSKEFSLDIQIEGAKTIYKDNEVEIYRGLTRKACIEYSTGYSWCIGRPGAGNLYYFYRFRPYEPTFYFVKDLKKIEKENFLLLKQGASSVEANSFNDKYHFFVIQVVESRHRKNIYFVTSAKNDGDKRMRWEEIVSICPALSDKKDLFKHVPLNEIERKARDKFYNKPLPSLKEFANLPYEEKQIFLAVRVNSLKDLPDEYFFLLPDSLKKEFIALRVGLTPKMYSYIIKNKDLNEYRQKVGDMLLTDDDENIKIEPEMVYYFFGLNLDNYINEKRFSDVLFELINFDKYTNKNYWENYIKYIPYVKNKVSFFKKIDELKLNRIALEIDESQIDDDILWIILKRCEEKVLENKKYKSLLQGLIKKVEYKDISMLLNSFDNRDWIALNLDESQIDDNILFKIFRYCGKKVLEHEKYKSRLKEFVKNLEYRHIFELIEHTKNHDWVALNLDESQIDNKVLFLVLEKCGEEVLEHEKYKSRLKEFIKTFENKDIIDLIERSRSKRTESRNWIALNLDESQINDKVLLEILVSCEEKVLKQERYKSYLKKLVVKDIVYLIEHAESRDWIALNLDESQIDDKVLFKILYKCGEEVLEHEKYKSRLKEFTKNLKNENIIYLIVLSENRDWIALNLDKSKINEESLQTILRNCSSYVVDEYKKYFNLN